MFVRSFILTGLVLLSTRCEGRIGTPYVETYWETFPDNWQDHPGDYCADLADVPGSPVGSCTGVNVIDIAFADYSGGINGTEAPADMIKQGVKAVHNKGGFVKLAFGGAKYSMGVYIQNQADVQRFAESVQAATAEYGFDGIDLDVEDGGATAETQVAVFRAVRDLMGPDFHISYTISALAGQFDPFLETIRDGVQYLDAINVMAYDYYWPGYNFDLDLTQLGDLGVPANKIVYGIMPGHSDAPNEYTSVDDAVEFARYAMSNGLCGVMTWSMNRDAYQRWNFPAGQDNVYQTGQENGKYINALSAAINNCEH